MFDAADLSNWFDCERTAPDMDHSHERLDLLTESFSWRFDPEFPCDFTSSATLTVFLGTPSPPADVLGVALFGRLAEQKPDAFFPARKAGLSGAERAELQAGRLAQEAPELAPEASIARQAQMAADGGTPEIYGGLREVTDPNQLFVRGGRNPVSRLQEVMPEVSGSSAPGRTARELAESIPTRSGRPYTEWSFTRVGEINRIGGRVYEMPLEGYPTHCVIICVSGEYERFPELLRRILVQESLW